MTRSTERYVINFFDWPFERASQYRLPLEVVEQKVRPIRAQVSRKAHRDYWWHYGDKRPALYKLLSKLSKAIIQTRHSKYLCPQFVPTGSVFSESTVVFPSDDHWLYGLLNSSIHECWARENSGSIGTGLRYTHTDCFYTFPLPGLEQRKYITHAGQLLEAERCRYRAERNCSVNEMMDAIHRPPQGISKEDRLRELHVSLDLSVAHAYGWDDLDLGHGSYEVPYIAESDRIRFTITETARIEVLRRLSELNRQRYQEEVAVGLHDNTAPKATKRQAAPAKVASSRHQAGFDFGDSINIYVDPHSASTGNQWGDKASDQILAWLEAHTGWFGKQAILTGCGSSSTDWDAAIAELLSDEFIETHADGNRWRAKP